MIGFQPARRIVDVLTEIENQQLILPAIQREFVWPEAKICALFDSLMRGYPIGGFLFWKITDETRTSHTFYGFIRDFDVRPPKNFCPKIDELSPSDSRFAVLDGQQRLTSLNIGLRGSHTVKLANKWWDNPDAFPRRHLYLALRATEPDPSEAGADNEAGDTERYVFRFRTPDQVATDQTGHTRMKVSDVLNLREMTQVLAYAADLGIGNDRDAMHALGRLYEVVHVQGSVSAFVEPAQDIDRVMNIFIRTNSQGEPLSFADLLLSQATAAWSSDEGGAPVDAREEIRSFNDHLNRPDHRFDFKRDQIMKACLVLTDAPSVRFQIKNYGRSQMLAIRSQWPQIKRCLDLAAQLLDQFGLTGVNLNARSVIHPLAYYIKHRNLDSSYLTGVGHIQDRERVRFWVLRSLLRQGIWGSGLDTLLTRLRSVIREHGAEGFPSAEIERAMGELGKSLAFDEDAVQGLLKLRYGEPNTFALLALVYPSTDLTRRHVDHIYPQSWFELSALRRAGLASEQASRLAALAQEMPNLQLLTSAENESKGNTGPATWLRTAFPEAHDEAAVKAFHHLEGVSDDLGDLEAFSHVRSEKLAREIRRKLGVADPRPGDVD